jgi:hypothetical protein
MKEELRDTVKNKHAVTLGRKGGKAGTGAAKARTSKQARAAALARWKKVKLQKAQDDEKSKEHD